MLLADPGGYKSGGGMDGELDTISDTFGMSHDGEGVDDFLGVEFDEP